jgi:hypothetical protein
LFWLNGIVSSTLIFLPEHKKNVLKQRRRTQMKLSVQNPLFNQRSVASTGMKSGLESSNIIRSWRKLPATGMYNSKKCIFMALFLSSGFF